MQYAKPIKSASVSDNDKNIEVCAIGMPDVTLQETADTYEGWQENQFYGLDDEDTQGVNVTEGWENDQIYGNVEDAPVGIDQGMVVNERQEDHIYGIVADDPEPTEGNQNIRANEEWEKGYIYGNATKSAANENNQSFNTNTQWEENQFYGVEEDPEEDLVVSRDRQSLKATEGWEENAFYGTADGSFDDDDDDDDDDCKGEGNFDQGWEDNKIYRSSDED